jgi:hypothetical protein
VKPFYTVFLSLICSQKVSLSTEVNVEMVALYLDEIGLWTFSRRLKYGLLGIASAHSLSLFGPLAGGHRGLGALFDVRGWLLTESGCHVTASSSFGSRTRL